jgi:hypothetical protein
MNRPALRAKMRAAVNRAERRLRELHASRDWLGVNKAITDYWTAVTVWRDL